ncbi:hypothetical protein MWU75_01765 [Ornithinimicrobium sp. F0845]|uniref:hypothetical protein n=1 Tax=Ornithinimicrobium sp. F0845 TaxID=2926412 RepID=UPI001FF4B4A2|nr:hypothetical protein [Ornithinimicrobium sp. F0845]MCK0110870.1 hypothetical protein [Ornithinimicrobium sp. F0845]
MRTKIMVGMAVTALVATACSGGAEDGLGTGEAYTVLGALAELPGPPSPGLMIQTADLTGATEAAGLERPDTPEGIALVEWISPLLGQPIGESGEPAPVFVPVAEVFNLQQLHQHQEFQESLGWSLVDVDSFAELVLPPERFAVVAGDFDESTLAADLPEVAEGVVTFGEGEDLSTDLENASVVSRLGQPIRLAQQDGRVVAASGTAAVEDWLAGLDETLADDESLAAVAAALDEQDAVSAVLLSGGSFQGAQTLAGSGAPESTVAQLQDELAGLPSAAFGTVGIGWTVQDGEPVIAVAYHLGSEDAVERAAPEFEAMYQDGVELTSGRPVSASVELLSVESSGQVLVVRAASAEPARVRWLLNQLSARDVPFAHQ